MPNNLVRAQTEIRDASFGGKTGRLATVDDDTLALWDVRAKQDGKIVNTAKVVHEASKFCACRFTGDAESIFTAHGQRDAGWITQWTGDNIQVSEADIAVIRTRSRADAVSLLYALASRALRPVGNALCPFVSLVSLCGVCR